MGYDGSDGPPRNGVPEPLLGVALCDLPADPVDVSAYARHGDQIRHVLQALFRISLARTSLEAQLEQVVAHISSLSFLALEAKGVIFLTDPVETDVLVLKAHRNMSQGLLTLCARVPFGRCLCGRAAATGEVVFAPCVDDRHENRPPGMDPHGHYCVPIVLRGRVLGVITLYVKDGHCQDAREEEFLSTVADALAGILEHRGVQEELAQTADRLKRALESITRALSLAVEIRDPYTAGHQRRVADLARAIAQEMGLRE
jgi:GAF domain-containing protein